MRWRQAAFAALYQSDLFDTESCGRRLGCHRVGSLGRVPWKQFLSELSLVLICHEVGMVTANHILGHFFSACVAMGIGVFCSFVFCEKREVLLPPLAYPPKCAKDEGVVVSHIMPEAKHSCQGRGCQVACLKISSGQACPSAVVSHIYITGWWCRARSGEAHWPR